MASAQYNLGQMYRKGEGVIQDYAEAVKWYRKAAEQGYALAQSNLGVVYASGEGVIQDNLYAHMWLNIAASLDDEEAPEYRDRVAKKMTPEDIPQAQKLGKRRLQMVCDAFRKIAGEDLGAANIENRFIDFCKTWRG
ncbi:tetratricopeptide repeat protein [Sulfitobacter sp.]|uniref:tetratricopeptide repeat protein n=1 Tax=Sulfitobacter sp. TaxID=1903071 RepID=UPI0030019758